MKKIRVVHFELDENLGGIETFLLNLLKQIDKNAIQFEFITAVKKPALEKEFVENGAIIHYVSAHSDLKNYIKDIDTILNEDIDVVHIHKNSAANIIPLIISKRKEIKKIFVHSHNTSPSIGKASKLLHYINRFYLNKVSNRKFACSSVAGKWLFGKNKFEIVPNGIIIDDFAFSPVLRETKREELGIKRDTFVVGNIGRFTLQKNQNRAVDIFEQLKVIHKDSKLILIGEGEMLSKTITYVESKKLENDVLFLRMRRDIPDILMAMDSFIMPSLYEGLPIVAIEAQSAGLPLILADTISKETQLTDAVTWFSLNDENGLIASKIISSLNNDEKTRKGRLMQVREKGYDMKVTAALFNRYYAE